MIICNNELTDEEVQTFKNYWNNNQTHSYVNWMQDGVILDRRLTVQSSVPEFNIVKRIVYKYFDNPGIIWSAYQRQNFAHNIHIDDYGVEANLPGYMYTFVFSMDTEPRFKTFVWKEQCHDNNALHEFTQSWGEQRASLTKKTNLSEQEDLEHTLDSNQEDYMCDYLDLDGVYTYKRGSGVLFSAKQLHCTSNWIKYKDIPYRELLQIHVQSFEPINI